MEEMAERFLEMVIQTNINDIAKLYSQVPDELNFSFLVAMKVALDSLLPSLSDHDRELYDAVLAASETVVIKIPRRMEEQT